MITLKSNQRQSNDINYRTDPSTYYIRNSNKQQSFANHDEVVNENQKEHVSREYCERKLFLNMIYIN